MLQTDFQICKEGDTLTPEQARLLVRILIKMQLFIISLLDIWLSKWQIYNQEFNLINLI